MLLCDLRVEALIHPSGHGQVPQGPPTAHITEAKATLMGKKVSCMVTDVPVNMVACVETLRNLPFTLLIPWSQLGGEESH